LHQASDFPSSTNSIFVENDSFTAGAIILNFSKVVTTGVVDTGGKSAGVNNAGGHLDTGVVDTGDAPSVASIFVKYLKKHPK
jgi:hypothetical protein